MSPITRATSTTKDSRALFSNYGRQVPHGNVSWYVMVQIQKSMWDPCPLDFLEVLTVAYMRNICFSCTVRFFGVHSGIEENIYIYLYARELSKEIILSTHIVCF